MKSIPKVGQTLYSLIGNYYRRDTEQKLTPVNVVKVGRKYFEVIPKDSNYGLSVHHIDSWREKTEYSPRVTLYESEQAYTDEKKNYAIY